MRKEGEHLTEMEIRTMTAEDYDAVYQLWLGIHGFAMRSVDDSREGIGRFLQRNPQMSVVAEMDGRIVGSILCGHDGRRGCFYHVCVAEAYRNHGIGKAMATECMQRLKAEQISKVSLMAFRDNALGNAFWHEEGWTLRDDTNTYDFVLNEENMVKFNR